MNDTSIKLLCIPYAGCSACYYNKWVSYFNNNITVYPLELAGRGMRDDEDFYVNIEHAIDDLFEKVISIIGKSEYVLFGHSMGALIAFELCNRLENREGNKPMHLIISGYSAPQLPQQDQDKDVREIVMELGGMPNEVWNDPFLYDTFMPILQADYHLIRNYRYSLGRKPLKTNISILYGEDDNKTPFDKIIRWRELTSGNFKYYSFKGGHFFINQYTNDLVDCIKNIIKLNKE